MDRSSFMGKVGLVVILSLIGLIVISSAVVQIDAGTVGVVKQFGKVDPDRVMDPGLNWKIPFVEDVELYNTKDVVYETSPEHKQGTSQADYKSFPVDTTTEDGQSVDLSYSIRFRVDRASAPTIAQRIGDEGDVVEKVVKFHSRILCRQVPRSYEASELYTGDVSVVEMDIVSQLEPLFLEKGLILDSFGIREIAFSDDYIEAIEQKQIEKERVITEQYRAEQAKYKKEASITEAEGEAESIRIKGEALAENPDMVQLEFVRSLRDPASKVQVMVIPMEGVLPLLSLPDMGMGELGGN